MILYSYYFTLNNIVNGINWSVCVSFDSTCVAFITADLNKSESDDYDDIEGVVEKVKQLNSNTSIQAPIPEEPREPKPTSVASVSTAFLSFPF